MNKSTTVLVVDDHRMVCDALVALVEKTGVCKKALPVYSGEEALGILKHKHIAVALIDFRMPGISGSALIKLIQQEHPKITIVGTTSFDDKETLQEMLQLNLTGIVLKRSTNILQMKTCLESVLEGKKYYEDEVRELLGTNQLNLNRLPSTYFTNREMQVLKLLSEGYSSKQIAEMLNLKTNSIDDYRKGMLRKTGTENTTGLVAFALRNGLL